MAQKTYILWEYRSLIFPDIVENWFGNIAGSFQEIKKKKNVKVESLPCLVFQVTNKECFRFSHLEKNLLHFSEHTLFVSVA